MSGVSYHELTHAEPRDSPARRKQFLLICTVGFAIFAHASISAGILESVNVDPEGEFKGGEYVYKLSVRDYAASGGYARRLETDINKFKVNDGLDLNEENNYDHITYHTFLDKTLTKVPAGFERFFTGVLIDDTDKDDEKNKELMQGLLNLNDELGKKRRKKKKRSDDEREEHWSTPYMVGTLPKSRALVAQFAFTNGFVSALMHQFKVFPALVKAAKKHGFEDEVVIISNCLAHQSLCTHYVPLENGSKFFMGNLNTEEYVKTVTARNLLNPTFFIEGWKEILESIGLLKKKSTNKEGGESGSDEL